MNEPVSSNDSQMTGQPSAANSLRRRHLFIVGAVVLLVAIVVVPPFINVNRFRRSIVHSIGAGLGRPVQASGVELQLFPLPGFVLHNLTVEEDPAYGAEPVMVAQTVTATLRASTLWHRRVEIASLHFDAPSVNLVRNSQGHWNFETLLRNSPALHRQNQSRSNDPARRPMPFPYVEASEARINFKNGAEKLPLSLEGAKLEVWKESNNQWRMRIRARPVRTDLTVSSAGEIRGEGSLTTAGTLADAAIRTSLEWRRVELGEIGRLVHGEDDGWRGIVDWTVEAKGTLSNVVATSDVAVEEFRRAEFIPTSEMDLSAHCQARYTSADAALDSVACDAPIGDGHLLVRSSAAATGNASPPVDRPAASPSFSVALQHVSAAFFLDLLRHVHPGVSMDDEITGKVDGKAICSWPRPHVAETCSGTMRSTPLRLKLAHMEKPVSLSSVVLTSPDHGDASPNAILGPGFSSAPAQNWRLLPMHVSLGDVSPATLSGTVSVDGFGLQITGPAELGRIRQMAAALRIPAISGEVQSLRGSATLNLSMDNTWLPRINPAAATAAADTQQSHSAQASEFAPAQWAGTLQLHNATIKLASLPIPIQMSAAHVEMKPTGVEWSGIQAAFAHTTFDGNVGWQTTCSGGQPACQRSFALHTPNLDVRRIAMALHGESGASDLLNLINPWSGASPQMHDVTGTLNADVLSLGKVNIKNAALALCLNGQTAQLTSLAGKVFGGSLRGAPSVSDGPNGSGSVGSMHWGNGAPQYALRAELQHIQPERVAKTWHEHWGPGTADIALDFTSQGWSSADLADNSNGNFRFAWNNGSLHVASSPASAQPERKFQQWTGKGTIQNRKLILTSSQWIPKRADGSRTGPAQSATGTITFSRMLHLKLEPSGVAIDGQLGMPATSPVPISASSPEPLNDTPQ